MFPYQKDKSVLHKTSQSLDHQLPLTTIWSKFKINKEKDTNPLLQYKQLNADTINQNPSYDCETAGKELSLEI